MSALVGGVRLAADLEERCIADPAIYPPEAAMAGLFAVASRPAAEKAALARAWRHLRLGL